MRKRELVENLDFGNAASVYVIENDIILAYKETKHFVKDNYA